MKFSAAAILLTAAIGASAHPSGHAHRHAHRSIEARDFFMAKKPAPPMPPKEDLAPPPKPAPAPTSVEAPAPPPPPPTVEAKPEPKPKPSPPPPAKAAAADSSSSSSKSAPSPSEKSDNSGSGSSGSGAGSFVPFCGGSKSKRATAAQIAYQGNLGGSGSSYGCNQMPVQSSVADKYDYTIKFKNSGSSDKQCVCWNKIGPDFGINGFFKNNEAIKFSLPGNGEQYVAFDTNTQGGCSCGTGSVALTAFGQYAGSWVEFDFGNGSNGDWSGFDASCLVPAKLGLDIPALEVCDDKGTCSTIYAGGTGKNAYLKGMEDDDGVGGNLPAGKVRLTATY